MRVSGVVGLFELISLSFSRSSSSPYSAETPFLSFSLGRVRSPAAPKQPVAVRPATIATSLLSCPTAELPCYSLLPFIARASTSNAGAVVGCRRANG
ncbi:hypothetical protein NL676_039266 [Syzygium grande]|nr:hypothetical protein NL676_039266 [Syzygium grande]